MFGNFLKPDYIKNIINYIYSNIPKVFPLQQIKRQQNNGNNTIKQKFVFNNVCNSSS